MELLELIKIIKKHFWAILAIEILFIGLGLGLFFVQKDKYEASLLFYVKRKIEAISDKYYSYDGYYASQVGKEYTDTVIGFFQSIDVLKRASTISPYVPSETSELRGISGLIKVEKEAPQLIRVSVTSENREEAKEIVKSLGQAGIERVSLLNQTGDPHLSVDVVDSEPIIFTKKTSLPVYIGLGLLSGIVISFVFVLVLEVKKYLK